MAQPKGVVTTVIVALLIDLLAFTIILPLFPRLLNYYRHDEADNKGTLLGYALQGMEQYKEWIKASNNERGDKWDTVFLGGLLGSLFSFLQFVVSPMIGSASDRLGRRKVLLITMIGNLLSTAIWIFARSFSMFLLARIVAGLSEGNVQLSIAIISDVTAPNKRSRNLALVGICFAVAFTLGPAIGAWFSAIDLTRLWPAAGEYGINPYSMPALVALILLAIETFYIFTRLPETVDKNPETAMPVKSSPTSPPSEERRSSSEAVSDETKIRNLRRFKLIHCLHLLLFSGMEFTLVFLTFDVFDYTNMQQGKLLGIMGILSALFQGGYVRRCVQKVGEKAMVIQGMGACSLGLACLALVATTAHTTAAAVRWLYLGIVCLALTSGTVVNCLTGLASLQCQEDNDPNANVLLAKGRALGEFRSAGQLGRALGPISACGLYWIAGPERCYGTGAVVMGLFTLLAAYILPGRPQKVKSE